MFVWSGVSGTGTRGPTGWFLSCWDDVNNVTDPDMSVLGGESLTHTHINTHQDLSLWPKNVCIWEFRQKWSILSHFKIHHVISVCVSTQTFDEHETQTADGSFRPGLTGQASFSGPWYNTHIFSHMSQSLVKVQEQKEQTGSNQMHKTVRRP